MPIFESTVSQRDQFRKAASDRPGEALKKGNVLYYTSIVLTYFIATVLLFAGISKIILPEALVENLSTAFSFLPSVIVVAASTLLPVVEIGVGTLLLASFYNEKIKSKRKLIKFLTVSLFAIFLFYSIYGFVIGTGSDCGCFGNTLSTSFGWGMIIRNLIFLGMAVFLLKAEKE